jgi:6,7-dimethyl-8-ribityllumazine synthase
MSIDKPTGPLGDASNLRFAVVAARYNESLSDRLLSSLLSHLRKSGAKDENLVVERVPGSHEVPGGLALLTNDREFDCLIGLGVVLKGDTSHHKLVGESASFGLQQLALKHKTPAINGIVVVDDHDQAEARVGAKIERGSEFAATAVTMGNLRSKWKMTEQ